MEQLINTINILTFIYFIFVLTFIIFGIDSILEIYRIESREKQIKFEAKQEKENDKKNMEWYLSEMSKLFIHNNNMKNGHF